MAWISDQQRRNINQDPDEPISTKYLWWLNNGFVVNFK
jgi:hypothetical protein